MEVGDGMTHPEHFQNMVKEHGQQHKQKHTGINSIQFAFVKGHHKRGLKSGISH